MHHVRLPTYLTSLAADHHQEQYCRLLSAATKTYNKYVYNKSQHHTSRTGLVTCLLCTCHCRTVVWQSCFWFICQQWMLPVKCAIPTVRYDVCCVVLIVMQQFNTLRVYKKATCVLKCVIELCCFSSQRWPRVIVSGLTTKLWLSKTDLVCIFGWKWI